MQMTARREGTLRPRRAAEDRPKLDSVRPPPGRWEFALDPLPALYASGFQTNGIPVPGRADGWNEDMIVSGVGVNTVKFVLSNSPGSVHGAVTLGTQQALGAPVFLEYSEIEPARRFKEPFVVRTDTRGQYQFSGLAPGEYRLLATFEYQSPTAAEFDLARAVTIKIEEARDLQKDLNLFVAR